MQRARGQIKGARVEQQEGAISGGDGGQFWKPDIVANPNGDFPIGVQIHDRHFVPRAQHLRLPEDDFAGDVDVEQMHFPMRGQEFTRGREEEGSVVVFSTERVEFGNTTP